MSTETEQDVNPHFGDAFLLNGEPLIQMKRDALKRIVETTKKVAPTSTTKMVNLNCKLRKNHHLLVK